MSATNDLNKQIVDLGNYRGGFLWRNNTGALKVSGRFVRFGFVGSGDVIGIYHGHFVSIETKTGRDVASNKQIEFAEQVNRLGGFACFAHDIDEAIEFFDHIDKTIAERNGAQVIPF